jgi:hypothetical protein
MTLITTSAISMDLDGRVRFEMENVGENTGEEGAGCERGWDCQVISLVGLRELRMARTTWLKAFVLDTGH